MVGQHGNRRRFVAALAGIPPSLAGSRWVAPAAAATDYGATPTVPADQGLQRLMDGNQRFVAGKLTVVPPARPGPRCRGDRAEPVRGDRQLLRFAGAPGDRL